MRYVKFLQLNINYSNGIINIKNNDDKGNHWLFLTFPDLWNNFLNYSFNVFRIILQDPFGNDFGLFYINYSTTTSTATYLEAIILKDNKTIPFFIPYNWVLQIFTNMTTSGSSIFNCVVIAFDNLEELVDYAFGNAK